MRGALVEFRFSLLGDKQVEPGEIRAQVLERHQQLRRVHRSPGSMVHLIGMICHEDETSAGPQSRGGGPVYAGAQSGWQMDERGDDARPRARVDGEGAEVRRERGQHHAVACGELARLREAHCRLVHGGHGVAAPGEEHGVATLALAEAEDRALRKVRGAFGDEGVRLRSVTVIERAVPPVPEAGVVGHRRAGSDVYRHRIGPEELLGDWVSHPEVAEHREAQAARALIVEARFVLQ